LLDEKFKQIMLNIVLPSDARIFEFTYLAHAHRIDTKIAS